MTTLSNHLARLSALTMKTLFEAYLSNFYCMWIINTELLYMEVYLHCGFSTQSILKLCLMDYLIGIRCSLNYFPKYKHLLRALTLNNCQKEELIFFKMPFRSTINQTSFPRRPQPDYFGDCLFLIYVSVLPTILVTKITTHTYTHLHRRNK